MSKVGTVTAHHGTLSSGYTDTDALSRFESVHFPTSQLRSTGFGILSTTKAEPWMMTYLSGIVHIRAEARGACYGLLDKLMAHGQDRSWGHPSMVYNMVQASGSQNMCRVSVSAVPIKLLGV